MTGEYMIAKVNSMNINPDPGSNADEIEFQVRFGNIRYYQNPDGTNGSPILDSVIGMRVTFRHAELSDWGTDDSIIYQKIAAKLGFTIIETLNLPFEYNG